MLMTMKKQRGLSIVEVLVGITISLVVATAILGIFANTIISSQHVIETGKLDRDLGGIMDVIATDVQRAGYWSKATTNHINPFMATGTDLAVSGGNCVIFTYDRNDDGVVQDNEEYGYRLNGNAIQFRPAGSTFNCAAGPTSWENLTDPNVIVITQFAASLIETPVVILGTATTFYRKVTITLAGHLTGDSATTKTITRTINLYNNKYSP